LRIAAARPVPKEDPSLGRIINLARYEVSVPKALDFDFAALAARARTVNGVRDVLSGPLRTLVLDLSIEPGIKLFDALAGMFETSDIETRRLSVQRRDCLVALNGRIRTPLEE